MLISSSGRGGWIGLRAQVVAFVPAKGVRYMDLDAYVAVVAAAIPSASADELGVVLGEVARWRRLADAIEIDCLVRLEELAAADPSINPEQVHAAAANRSVAACVRAGRRAMAAVQFGEFRRLVAAGRVSGEHLDAFARAVRGLELRLRPQLVGLEASMAVIAPGITIEDFTERLRAEVRRIEADDGVDRLARQKRRTGLRQWTDKDGMLRWAGRFDPETGLTLAQVLQQRTEALFHGPRSEHCPADPVLAHEFLQAMALVELVTGTGGVGGAEIIVTIDEETWLHGRHARSRVDCGRGIEVPIETIRSLASIAGRTRFVPVVVDANGVVIVQGRPVPSFDQLRDSLLRPVCLDAGRTRRFATRDQRRALRAMYRRCAIPGCEGHISRTTPHHLEFWENGGATDLRLLLPLCPHHHARLHADGWDVTLAPDRSLVVRRDGEVVMSTGPPALQWR